jgi:tetratricopeptide (TPR) repeat protein
LINRGRSYNSKGAYDRALQDLDEAIRIDPKMAVAYNNRGLAFTNKGDPDRGIRDFNEAIDSIQK